MLLPAVVALVFGQPGSALLTVLANLIVLGLVYVVAGYGLVPMTRWAIGQTFTALGTISGLVGRALPLLFALTILTFVNTEAWQVAAALPVPLFAVTAALFVVVGLLSLVTRLPREVARIDGELDAEGVVDACRGTPLEATTGAGEGITGAAAPPLGRRQRLNVYLVFQFAQAVQAALVTVVVFVFFTGFGLVAVRPEVVAAWLGDAVDYDVVAALHLFGHRLEVTTALLHVSAFVACIAGFSFTISLVTDAGYREEFLAGIAGEVRQALGVRAVYLRLL